MKYSSKRIGFLIAVALQLIFLLFLFLILYRGEWLIEDRPMKFGATYMTMNNPYFKVLNEGIKEVVESNGDILITRDPAQDQKKQNNQILEMLEEGVKAIFLNPVDWKGVEPALKACYEAEVPVFNIDTLVYDYSYVVSL